MILISLLLQINFILAKEVRILSFPNSQISVCGSSSSWGNVILGLTAKEVNCLDSKGPFIFKDSTILESSEISEQSIERAVLIEKLKNVRGQCLDNSELLISDRLKLKFIDTISENVISNWIEFELQKKFPFNEIELGRLVLPKIDCHKTQFISWFEFRLDSKNTFHIDLKVDEKKYGVTGDFHLFQKVPVVLRNIAANEKIALSDLELQRKEVTFSPGYILQMDELIGRLLNAPIPQGDPIPVRVLKQINYVEKGQVIQAQFRGESFLVTSAVMAEQNGLLGDLVKVKNVESQKIFSGLVLGKGLVEVQ